MNNINMAALAVQLLSKAIDCTPDEVLMMITGTLISEEEEGAIDRLIYNSDFGGESDEH